MDEEKIEELVERKVEEKIEQKVEKKTGRQGESGLDQLIDEKLAEEFREHQEQEGGLKDKKLSRRSFLKALGLGAGGLALSSSAAAGLLTFGTDTNIGPDSINADTVDGKEASELGDTAGWNQRNLAQDQTTTALSNSDTTTALTTSPYTTDTQDKKFRAEFTVDGTRDETLGGTLRIKVNGNTLAQTNTKKTYQDTATTYTRYDKSLTSQDKVTIDFHHTTRSGNPNVYCKGTIQGWY